MVRAVDFFAFFLRRGLLMVVPVLEGNQNIQHMGKRLEKFNKHLFLMSLWTIPINKMM